MNAHITKNNNISAGTVARTAVLGLALANQILSACGKPLLPIDSAQLEQWVTAGLTSAAAIWAWWENNSFTKEALAADSSWTSWAGWKPPSTCPTATSAWTGTQPCSPPMYWKSRRAPPAGR